MKIKMITIFIIDEYFFPIKNECEIIYEKELKSEWLICLNCVCMSII